MTTMIKAPSQEAQKTYDELAKKLGELRAELGKESAELSAIMSIDRVGQLVGEGQPYTKQLERAVKMRHQIEALELGIMFLEGQIGLLERSNYGLNKR